MAPEQFDGASIAIAGSCLIHLPGCAAAEFSVDAPLPDSGADQRIVIAERGIRLFDRKLQKSSDFLAKGCIVATHSLQNRSAVRWWCTRSLFKN